MSATLYFVISAVAYLALIALAVYFYVLADPEESTVARFFQEKIPQKAWWLLEHCLGPRSLSVVEFFLDRVLMLFYCVVVFGSWSIIFSYIYQWVDQQDYVSHYHKYAGYAVFGACVTSWRWACNTSPGTITAKNIHRYDHFPFDDIMFVGGSVCPTRNLPRLARSKFDRIKYNENIPRYDHYCGWVHNVIGEENYRWFLLFLFVHVGMCIYGSYVLGNLFFGLILENRLMEVTFVDRYSGEEIKATKYIILQYLFSTHLLEAGLLAIMSVMSIALGLFLCYHAWLTSRGLTSNEAYKWAQVKAWYKREMKRFNDAVKNEESKASTRKPKKGPASKSVVTDGDGTADVPVEQYEDDDKERAYYPGPPPVNIYNRGFVENWKEVVFPLSLRKLNTKSKET